MPTIGSVLSDAGLLGEHQLLMIERHRAVDDGSIYGQFFLGTGTITEKTGSSTNLQFYWEPKKNEIVASTLPYSMFRFVLDETKNIPTIEFIFEEYWLNWTNPLGKALDVKNLNDFIMKGENLRVVIVKISKETMAKEIYLPKP